MKNEKEHKPSGWVVQAFFHLLAWVCIFAAPLMFHVYNESFEWGRYLHGSLFPLSLCVLFYLNYLWLVPTLIPRKLYVAFSLYNLAAFALLALVRQQMNLWLLPPEPGPQFMPGHVAPPRWAFVLRDFLTYAFAAGVAVTLRLSMQWRKAEQGRREAELGRAEAELQNLKSQLNPHFLFNTLNNIYSLIAFSPERAQEAVHDLSRLLRYVLYDSSQPTVPLDRELNFINNYVELMRIRLPEQVKLTTRIKAQNPETPIAPLLFISLIENAFKHGVSPVQPSFIDIDIHEEEARIVCCIRNSCFPKDNERDKSGSGIGLHNLSRRLELLYPARHIFTYGEKEGIYTCRLELQT